MATREPWEKDFEAAPTAGKKDNEFYYMKEARCPYSKEWPVEPAQMREWEKTLMADFNNKVAADHNPTGPTVNDHNYTTRGAGNTIGLLAGSLSIGQVKGHELDKLPAEAQVGLFSKKGLYPMVLRFSDFGADGEIKLKHLSRLAVKVNVPKDISWCEEFNMTFVETVDSFTYANFVQIEARTRDKEQNLRAMRAVVQNASGMWNNWNSGMLVNKTYYSQLPHKLGDKYAMKYRLVPIQKPVGTVDDDVTLERMALSNYIAMRPAYYALELQVVEMDSGWMTDYPADRWEVEYIRVGCMTIAKQDSDDMAISKPLVKALTAALALKEEEKPWLHKLFMFHPMLAPEIHMPTGETQHFRCHYYAIGTHLRLSCFGTNVAPSGVNIEPKQMPFTQLKEDAVMKTLFEATPVDPLPPMPAVYDDMDKYTKMLCTSVPKAVFAANTMPVTDVMDCDDVSFHGPQEHAVIDVGHVSIRLNEADQEFGKLQFNAWAMLKGLQSGLVFPIDDVLADCTEEEGEIIQNNLGLTEALPPPTHIWTEMESDAAIERLYMVGAGGVLLSIVDPKNDFDKPNDPLAAAYFVADTSILATLKVRDGFRKYGSKVYFNKDKKLLAIHDSETNELILPPKEDDKSLTAAQLTAAKHKWQCAKFLSKCSLNMFVTGGHHLLWTHFLVANTMVLCMVEFLPVHHPLRRLLEPFTFRTNYVNNRAKDSLLPENSMFHHATALDYEKGVVPMIELGTKMCDFWMPFSDRVAKMDAKMKTLPFAEDGAEYYEVVRLLVDEWLRVHGIAKDKHVHNDLNLKKFYMALVHETRGQGYKILAEDFTREHLVKVVAQFMFVVTGIHDFVGSVVEYNGLRRTGFRCRKNSDRVDVQSWLIASTLVATTSIRTPTLMSKWSNYFTMGPEIDTWGKFLERCEKLSVRVQQKNADKETRPHPLNNFDPKFLECAVSV